MAVDSALESWRSWLPSHHSNAGAEKSIAEVTRVIATRDFALRNKFPTNQMLELVRARCNHEADEIVFARTLRAALEGGQNLDRQLACRDVGTNLSGDEKAALWAAVLPVPKASLRRQHRTEQVTEFAATRWPPRQRKSYEWREADRWLRRARSRAEVGCRSIGCYQDQ